MQDASDEFGTAGSLPEALKVWWYPQSRHTRVGAAWTEEAACRRCTRTSAWVLPAEALAKAEVKGKRRISLGNLMVY